MVDRRPIGRAQHTIRYVRRARDLEEVPPARECHFCDLEVGTRGLFAQTDRHANGTNGCIELLSLPPGLALTEKTVNPLLEVLARISLYDVLRAAGRGPMPHD